LTHYYKNEASAVAGDPTLLTGFRKNGPK
jgi:hypothetical protein